MEDLVKLLHALEEDSAVEEAYEFLPLDHPMVAEISRLADELLITPDGKCHWDHVSAITSLGYPAFAVEKDSFGWLVGGISTKKGVITYG